MVVLQTTNHYLLTTTHQPRRGSPVANLRENATCSTWGDPKTAVAPLPRAPLHHQPPTNNY
ncbi:MAG: hypothetical protein ACHBN1_28020 [Heteroscytonema crispum UTEX LB 1556]